MTKHITPVLFYMTRCSSFIVVSNTFAKWKLKWLIVCRAVMINDWVGLLLRSKHCLHWSRRKRDLTTLSLWNSLAQAETCRDFKVGEKMKRNRKLLKTNQTTPAFILREKTHWGWRGTKKNPPKSISPALSVLYPHYTPSVTQSCTHTRTTVAQNTFIPGFSSTPLSPFHT